ncbi:MAG: glycoside hydrolase family 2 protein [Eubacteriales bacterium]
MLNWELGYSDSLEIKPAEMVEAFVPSDVQLVWQKQKGLPDYNFGQNYLEYKWMEDKFWHYTTSFDIAAKEGYEPFIRFESIDYRYMIYINDNLTADGEGMFTPVMIPLAKHAGSSVKLEVVIFPIPKVQGKPEDRSQASMCAKPAVSYGWDWHPRLVPSGLSDEVNIIYLPISRIEENDFLYNVTDDLLTADYLAKIRLVNPIGNIKVEIIDADNVTVVSSSAPAAEYCEIKLSINNLHLWWCVRQGEQYLYKVRATLESDNNILDISERRIGFRRVRLLMNGDSWDNGDFPGTQAHFPMTLELNGRRIFCKGTNYVPPEIFYSRMTYDVYYKTLVRALDCNMNMLRVWGGGLTNRESFFNICDEMGLMVWQEFPLSCNDYPDDPHYLSVLNRESISIIKRVKSHPCTVLWCGGNELFCGWSRMTNQSHALRLLDKNCFEYDPNTPYIMTSPLYGVGHGHYLALHSPDRECVSIFIDNYRTAYTEFGSPSAAPFDYIKQYIPESELYKIEDSTSWQDHHALYAWCDRETWFRPSEIEGYFGKSDSLEQQIERSMVIQSASYRGLFEEARRKWPMTSMALNWCFNEPWPCFANNSLIIYPDIPKPAYYEVKNALRDVMLSAKLYKLRWWPGEKLEAEIYILNDLPKPADGCAFKVRIAYADKNVVIGESSFQYADALSSKSLIKCLFNIPADITSQFKLYIDADDIKLSTEYTLFSPPKEIKREGDK